MIIFQKEFNSISEINESFTKNKTCNKISSIMIPVVENNTLETFKDWMIWATKEALIQLSINNKITISINGDISFKIRLLENIGIGIVKQTKPDDNTNFYIVTIYFYDIKGIRENPTDYKEMITNKWVML